MSKQIDYANMKSTWRSRQNRLHKNRVPGFKKLRLRDFWYFGMSALIIGSFINSATHIKYITVPVPTEVHAQTPIMNYAIEGLPLMKPKITPLPTPSKDDRVNRLRSFFNSKGSPLADFAEVFVNDSDKFGLDYTLMPSISCKESSCGLALPDGSYNPFGLGGSNFMWFNSFSDAIDFEAQLLSSDYRGNMVQAIGSKYCPASDNCASNWADVVTQTQFDIINK